MSMMMIVLKPLMIKVDAIIEAILDAILDETLMMQMLVTVLNFNSTAFRVSGKQLQSCPSPTQSAMHQIQHF